MISKISTTKWVSLLILFVFASWVRAQEVTSLTLVNASTNKDIQTLNDGDTINLYNTGFSLNIRANTNPSTVGSVRFGLDGKNNYQTENAAPYALAGDNRCDKLSS